MSQSKFTASERGLVGAICSIYGLNYNTVSAQIKSLIMDAICCAHGNAGWFELPAADSGEMLDDIVALGQKFVDMNSTTIEALADRVITQDEYKAMQKVGHALIGQIQKILKTAKAMERE